MRNPGCSLPLLVVALLPASSGAQTVSLDRQIDGAVRPLHETERAGATVLGYRVGTTLEVIREGDNRFVCLADEPGNDQFQVSCYHRDLEPFMARGRELRAEGKNMAEVRSTRAREIGTGALSIPDRALLITLYGDVNPDTGDPDSVAVLQVVYLPHATAEGTGMSVTPTGPGQPFLMDAGLYRAHLMIPGPTRPFER